MMNQKNSSMLPIIIIGILFFIFGFVTWLNSTLIPYLQLACELSNFEAMLVAFAFYISYFVLAIPSSWILEKTGFKNGMSLGLSVMAIGSLVFIPAAITRTYSLFLTGLFIQGAGLSLLQTASNPYVTILGPIESAARRMSIMGLANKIAGILSPLILGAIILKNTDAIESSIITMSVAEKNVILDALAHRVIEPYVIMAVVLFVLAIAIRFSALPKISNDQSEEQSKDSKQKGIFSYTYLWLGVLALFFYVGVEVIAVDTIITYGKSIGFEISKARFFASFTLFGMIAGYLLGIITIPKIISQSKALAIMAVLGVIFTLLGVVTEGMMSVISIALLGFANAIMWPAIWPLSIEGLGKHTKLGSALLIMAIAGGAILPLVYGALSDLPHIGTQTAYLIMVPCYLFIMFFAVKGYKIGRQ
jgi:MFS transporter, FHS family, L-fucose permease